MHSQSAIIGPSSGQRWLISRRLIELLYQKKQQRKGGYWPTFFGLVLDNSQNSSRVYQCYPLVIEHNSGKSTV